MRALRNRSLWLFAAAYVLSLAVLWSQGRGLEEPLTILVLFGIAFPALAFATTLRAPAPGSPSPPHKGEAVLLIALIAYIAIFLAFKAPILGWIEPAAAEPLVHDTLNALLKLVAFVAVPLLVYRVRYGAIPKAGAPGMSSPRLWLSFAIVGTALFVVTLAISNGAKGLLDDDIGGLQLVAGLLFCFVWMAIEAGVVEEVFFRGLLQSRLAAITGSQLSAICLCALAFGLAHAPGMWLRGAGESEGLGSHPELLTTIAYAITVQGVFSLTLGVMWARTRSLPLVIALHAVVDTASNAGSFIDKWL